MNPKIHCKTAVIKAGSANISDIERVLKEIEGIAAKGCFVQLCSLRPVAGFLHVQAALGQALSALERKNSFSKNPSLEFLLRLTGKRQIGKALKIAGLVEDVKGEKQNVLLVIAGSQKKELAEAETKIKKLISFSGDNTLFTTNAKKNKRFIMKTFGISERLLTTLSDLPNPLESAAVEKTALLALEG